LVARAGRDAVLLESMVGRRLTGEPLAWITGTAAFCGMALAVDPGVYVPRWQSEPLARRAVARLPEAGAAIDLCTGTGAVAAVLAASRPSARVVAVDLDARSVACARHNGVEAFMGDLFDPVPPSFEGVTDVVVGVVPYVPTDALGQLARDTLEFETPLAYDGGSGGTVVLRRVLAGHGGSCAPAVRCWSSSAAGRQVHSGRLRAPRLCRRGGARRRDGDVRGVEATFAGARTRP